ncbi:MAG: UbiD family decarboxylase, partial [Thermodesulfobacteriota bacterium]|nr:UbiD family decarboxylase [Thermodesulfobacteriota bacterium]
RDLREWLEYLEENGELVRVKKEVDWNLEVGAIIRRVYDTMAPAPLFEKVKGYPECKIFGAPIGLSGRNRYARFAGALDMPMDSDVVDITEEYLRRKRAPLKPVIVKEGVSQENVLTGDDIDLFKFPAPVIHDGDGGRYISTWHTIITKDPESEWVNYGMYRQMIHDRNHLGGLIEYPQHIGVHYKKYTGKAQRMEFATVIGTEPVTAIMSAAMADTGESEADIIGGLRRESLELVKARTVELYVPACAEIVIEGYVDPHERREEGPFGEYTGYSASGKSEKPVYTVTAVTYRNNPILPVSAMGVPVDDSAVVMPLTMGAEVLKELRDVRHHPVKFVYFPPEGTGHFCAISTKVPSKTYPRHLAIDFWATKAGGVMGSILFIVDADVDITNLKDIIWALSTRVNPDKGIFKFPGTFTSPLLPWLSPDERKNREGARILIDGTWPFDWPKEWIAKVSSFKTIWPNKIQDLVLKNWKDYGF